MLLPCKQASTLCAFESCQEVLCFCCPDLADHADTLEPCQQMRFLCRACSCHVTPTEEIFASACSGDIFALCKWKCAIRPFDFCQCMPAAMQAHGINVRAMGFANVAQVELVVQRNSSSSTGTPCPSGCSCSACGTQEVLCSSVVF